MSMSRVYYVMLVASQEATKFGLHAAMQLECIAPTIHEKLFAFGAAMSDVGGTKAE